MFILKALLYLVTLPLRIVGTVIALSLKFIGIGLILLTTVCGMFTGILSGITMLCAVLVTVLALTGAVDIPNWWLGSISLFVVATLLIIITAFGEILGELISDWGSDLLGFSWRAGT